MSKKVEVVITPQRRALIEALIASNVLSLVLFAMRALETSTVRYGFLIWNVFLAWLPLFFAGWLVWRQPKVQWRDWKSVVLAALWLGFLPNSFYLVSDLIHLHTTGEISLLYDAVMFFSFIFNAYVAGFMSLYIMHRVFLQRLNKDRAYGAVAIVIFLCSFAIYLGRNLRWNTWDVLVNPAGLLFDVSDRIINPVAHPQAFVTTATFFLLLGSMYLVAWRLVRALKND